MAMVKVWNKNEFDYKEKFRDQHIHIPAGKYILMEAEEAHIFKGTFSPIIVDGDGNKIPEGFKMLRIEPMTSEQTVMELDSDKWAKEHLEANAGKAVIRDELAEAELARKKK